KNIARLSFYNYLNLFYKKEEEFTFKIIESFFLKSLHFSFWQENIVLLQDTIALDLQKFSVNWPIKEFMKKELIYVKNSTIFLQYSKEIKNSFNNCLDNKVKKTYDSQMLINHNKCLKVFTYPCNSKDIEIYTNLFFLNPPYLKNLPAITSLQYCYNFILKTNQMHYIQTSPLKTIVFFIDSSNLFTGLVVSGYAYEITNSFNKLPIHKIEPLCKSLSKIKKYFDLTKIQSIHKPLKKLDTYIDFN
ncbi:MAG: hypothetical protein HAW60_04800, partial [Bdellovibrionales bacterium]|nr:hypothetical protein [Bdellovibrionales bacterium]